MNKPITVDTAMELKLIPCDTPNIFVLVGGLNTINDGLGGWFYWDATSTATADDITIIKVTNITTGRWRIVSSNSAQGASYFGSSGAKARPSKKWMEIVTPSTASGYSIDISSAGFTTILGCSIIAIKNNSTANLSPNVSIKSISNTSLVVNIVEGNPATVVILSTNVLSGAPLVFASLTGLTLSVEVTGY